MYVDKMKKGIVRLTWEGTIEQHNKKNKRKNNMLKKIVNTKDTKLMNVFKYEDADILVIKDKNDKVWYKGKDVATVLEYKNTTDAIKKHVGIKYKIGYAELRANCDPLLKLDPSTIFISESGLLQLISKSKKTEAIKLWEFIAEEVIPTLFSKGTYSLPAKQSDIDKMTKNFYDENMISGYYNKHVVYLAYVGEYNKKHYLKFGISHNFVQRDLEQHRKNFKTFNVIKIWETLAKNLVEESIKHNCLSKGILTSMKKKDIHVKCKDNGKDQSIRELIVLNEVNGIDYCIKMIDDLVANTKIPQEMIYIEKMKENEHKSEIDKLKHEIELITEKMKRFESLLESKDKYVNALENNLQSKDYIITGLQTGNYIGKIVY